MRRRVPDSAKMTTVTVPVHLADAVDPSCQEEAVAASALLIVYPSRPSRQMPRWMLATAAATGGGVGIAASNAWLVADFAGPLVRVTT